MTKLYYIKVYLQLSGHLEPPDLSFYYSLQHVQGALTLKAERLEVCDNHCHTILLETTSVQRK